MDFVTSHLWIFPGANHSEVWALLSVKPRDRRACFQCLRIASGAESRLPLWWPALFPVRHSKRGKKKKKRKKRLLPQGPYLSPTGPQEQPHYTVVKSEVIQHKVDTKSLFFEKYKCSVERRGEIAVLEELHQDSGGGCAVEDV